MRIGDLASKASVNPKTIRYYESIGLLPEPDRTHAGYQRITELQVLRDELVSLDVRADELMDTDAEHGCPLIEHAHRAPST